MIDIRQLLVDFSTEKDRESATAFFLSPVPWLAPLAYLHIVFKPLPDPLLKRLTVELELPLPLNLFFSLQNGAILFSGALSFYGLHAPGQLLNREDPFCRLPFDIQDETRDWPPANPKQFLVVGGYGFDGSTIWIEKSSFRVLMFKRESNWACKGAFAWLENS